MPAKTIKSEATEFLTTVDIAKRYGVNPNVPCRWIVKGARLRDGTVVRLEASRLPGLWRISQEAWDEFLAILTADRLGPDPDRGAPPRKPGRKPKQSTADAQIDVELAARGYRKSAS
jgi:hypothetical protein